MAGLAEKDYGVKNDMGPMDTTVSPAVNAGEAGGFERSSSPPAYSLKAKAAGTADTESLNSDITLAAQEEGIDPAFYAKVQVLNRALSEIGMGRYQWELFFSGGFGWFADNIWLQAVAILMPWIGYEFIDDVHVKFATLALYAGLIVGASFWGASCDLIGRKLAWNCTLFIGGMWGVVAGAAPNFVALCCFIAFMGFGVGGNLPVDGTMYLEFLPGSHQWVLTLLSLWWAVGQVVASLISWAFIAKYSHDCTDYTRNAAGEIIGFCSRESNMGWRYAYFCLGAMMLFLWGLRFFVLPVYESPKYLCSKGSDEKAVEVVHKVAKRNGKVIHLTVEDLDRAAAPYVSEEAKAKGEIVKGYTNWQLLKMSVSQGTQMKTLFKTRRIAFSTSLIVLIYGIIGLAYPLFNQSLGVFLRQKQAEIAGAVSSVDDSFKSYTYQAACGIPGSMVAAFLVTVSRFGRKIAMAAFTLGAGIFLFGLTAAKNNQTVDALTCIAAFFQNAMYGVMFGYAPELFPTPVRGTGDALCAAAMRIFGLMAPIIAIYSDANKSPNGPVYASAALYLFSGCIMFLLPVETQGKTAL